MIKQTVCALSLGLAGASLQGSVDFTPATGERILDGIKFEQLVFRGEDQKIIYEQPRGWRYSGSSSRITFSPPDLSQAEAAIEQSPLEKPQNFDDETIKLLQQQVVAGMQNTSPNVTLVSSEKNPLLINGHETLEVTVAYQISGVEFQRSVLFLNLPDTQLRFRVTARKQDFAKVHKTFLSSLNSLQGLK